MTLEEVYRICITMKVGDSKQFELDEEPPRGALTNLTIRVNGALSHRNAVSFNRSGKTLWAHCYVYQHD